MMETVACHLCGNTQLEKIRNDGQFGLPAHSVICPNDGLVLLSPRWDAAQYQTFYEQQYDAYYRPKDVDGDTDYHKAKVAQGKLVWQRIGGKLKTEPAHILDIVAGMGWSLRASSMTAPNAARYAIEASPAGQALLRDSIGATVITGDVNSTWETDYLGKFDVVIMRHVLEHFLDPIAVLKKVAAVLAPEGLLYVAVPDMMSPRGSLTDYWFRAVHTYYFSTTTLDATAAMAGLAAIASDSADSELWTLYSPAIAESTPVANATTYERQRATIAAHDAQWQLQQRRTAIPRTLARLLPRSVKKRLSPQRRQQLKRRLK